MGRLPDDVLEFIDARFAPRDRQELARLLQSYPTMAPRVLRAVLYLADGRIGLLRHYLDEVQADVRTVILAAEYVVGVAAEPLHMRDMTEPFSSERNLGASFAGSRRSSRRRRRPRRMARRSSRGSGAAPAHHVAIVNRRFQLGSISYLVMADQPSARHVRCHRIEGNVATMVRLPFEFVWEQLAEHVELESLRFAG